jgi:hypothetical protein
MLMVKQWAILRVIGWLWHGRFSMLKAPLDWVKSNGKTVLYRRCIGNYIAVSQGAKVLFPMDCWVYPSIAPAINLVRTGHTQLDLTFILTLMRIVFRWNYYGGFFVHLINPRFFFSMRDFSLGSCFFNSTGVTNVDWNWPACNVHFLTR